MDVPPEPHDVRFEIWVNPVATVTTDVALYDPPGRDPLTLSQDPRVLHVSSSGFSYGTDASPDVGWTPCAGSLDDAAFPVLAEQEVPIGESGDTLLLQHSVQRLCQLQNPVVQLGTRTEGCGMQVDLYVDRVFGTLVPVAGEVGASCTRP